MGKRTVKYIHIRHWDYWWSVYSCGRGAPAAPRAVEFSLTDDEAGDNLFFRFDFYNLPGLRDTIREVSFMEEDHPDHASFLRWADSLERGWADYFIGALYYRNYMPDMAFCNQPLTPEHALRDLTAPPAPPCCAVLFLAEERPLLPEVLVSWMNQLAQRLFGQDFTCEIARVPTRQEAMKHWRTRGPV